MNTDSNPVFDPDEPEKLLPPELAAAVDQARLRHPKPEAIEQLIARASRVGTEPRAERLPRRTIVIRLSAAVAVAAALIVLVFSILPRPPQPVAPEVPLVANAEIVPVYSAVSKRNLLVTGFEQIESDLNRAEQQIAEVSDQVELAQVQLDLRNALAEYRRSWPE